MAVRLLIMLLHIKFQIKAGNSRVHSYYCKRARSRSPERAKEVTKFNSNLHKLLRDMAETMYDAEGVGLAAPQIGILKRVIVVDVGDDNG